MEKQHPILEAQRSIKYSYLLLYTNISVMSNGVNGSQKGSEHFMWFEWILVRFINMLGD